MSHILISWVLLGMHLHLEELKAEDRLNLSDSASFARSLEAVLLHLPIDDLGLLLRQSGLNSEILQRLKPATGDIKISVPESTPKETVAELQRRLSSVGLGFVQILGGERVVTSLEAGREPEAVAPASRKPRLERVHVVPVNDSTDYKRFLKIQKEWVPFIAGLTAVIMGAVIIAGGEVQSAGQILNKTPVWYKQLIPFLTQGIAGGLFQHAIYHKKLKQLLFNPRFGVLGRLIRDSLYPLIVGAVGSVTIMVMSAIEVSMPMSGESHILQKALYSFLLSSLSVGLAEFVVDRLRSRTIITHSRFVRFGLGTDIVANVGRMSFLTSVNGLFGALVQGLYAGLVTAPLLYKWLIGDRLDDWYTRLTITGALNKRPLANKCLGALVRLGRWPSQLLDLGHRVSDSPSP